MGSLEFNIETQEFHVERTSPNVHDMLNDPKIPPEVEMIDLSKTYDDDELRLPCGYKSPKRYQASLATSRGVWPMWNDEQIEEKKQSWKRAIFEWRRIQKSSAVRSEPVVKELGTRMASLTKELSHEKVLELCWDCMKVLGRLSDVVDDDRVPKRAAARFLDASSNFRNHVDKILQTDTPPVRRSSRRNHL